MFASLQCEFRGLTRAVFILSPAWEHVIILEARGKGPWELHLTAHFGDPSLPFLTVGVARPQNKHDLFTQGGDEGWDPLSSPPAPPSPFYSVPTCQQQTSRLKNDSPLALALTLAGLLFKATLLRS